MKNKQREPKVDILIPYWGEFRLLKEAVDSVLNQSESNWRLTIIDDHYPSDEAYKFYNKYPDKRVSYIRNKENIGLVKNYNFALTQAKASYCVIMGCDDVMLPDYLEKACSNIGDADYYHPQVEVINENSEIYYPFADKIKRLFNPKKIGYYSGEEVAKSLCHGNWTYFPSIMWKSSSLKKYGFDETLPNTQDVVTQLEIICNGGSVFVDDNITFQYRRSKNSFSSKAKSGTRFKEENRVYNNFAIRFRVMGWKKASRAARIHISTRLHQIMAS